MSFSPSPETGKTAETSAETINSAEAESSASAEERELSSWDKDKLRDWTAELLRARLIEAILEQKPDRVERLLEQGADPLDRRRHGSPRGGRYGRTLSFPPLLYGVGYVHHGQLRTTEVLSGSFQVFGYKVEGPFKPSPEFNSDKAAEIAKLLIESGADPDNSSVSSTVQKHIRSYPVPQEVVSAVEETARGEYREPDWALEVEENLDHIKGLWDEYAHPVDPSEFPS